MATVPNRPGIPVFISFQFGTAFAQRLPALCFQYHASEVIWFPIYVPLATGFSNRGADIIRMIYIRFWLYRLIRGLRFDFFNTLRLFHEHLNQRIGFGIKFRFAGIGQSLIIRRLARSCRLRRQVICRINDARHQHPTGYFFSAYHDFIVFVVQRLRRIERPPTSAR